MYYELYFNPSSGKWRIRIITVYLFFFSWSRDVMTDDAIQRLPHEFSTYDQVAAHADKIGLPKAYYLCDRSRGYSAWVQGSGCHGTN